MRIFDFLSTLNPSLDPAETKLHLATLDKETGDDPLNLYLRCKFKEWQRWQPLKYFHRKFVLSLIDMQCEDKCLFAGVYYSRKWLKDDEYYYYKLTEDPLCRKMNGRLVTTFPEPPRNARLDAERWSNQILISEILAERGFIPIEELELPHPRAKDGLTILSHQIENTTKVNFVKVRVGQFRFRLEVLQLWGNRCAVTRSETLDAIRASHIKPWRVSDPNERLDAYNGLPLVASLDALFDAGLISFASSGSLIVSSELSESEQQIFGVNTYRSLTKTPPKETERYLEYHRDCVFKK